MSFVGLACLTLLLGADFTYDSPGVLKAGSGSGVTASTVWAPGIRFPIEEAPAFLNSQVWGHGGISGPGGGQCEAANYSYPWQDNFCETRTYANSLCPTAKGHQGQDMRAKTCANKTHWAVAAEDGEITSIGTYSVNLMGESGTLYKYLHLDPATLVYGVGASVDRGARMGLVSNAFGDTATTIHLHFEAWQNVQGVGVTPVPPYTSLVSAYNQLLAGATCEALAAAGGILDEAGPCVTLYGSATYWRVVENAGYADGLRWTYAWTSASPGNWARFQLEFEEEGLYELEYYVAPGHAGSEQVPMRVAHADGETDLEVDLTEGNGWLSLGSFDFDAWGEQWLSVYDNTGEATGSQKKIPVDALRVTRVFDGQPDGGGPQDGGGDPGGGDSASPGDASNSGSDPGVQGDTDLPSKPKAQTQGGCAQGTAGEWLMVLFACALFYRRHARALTRA